MSALLPLAISKTSLNPFVVIRAVLTPFLSSKELIVTVLPCTKKSIPCWKGKKVGENEKREVKEGWRRWVQSDWIVCSIQLTSPTVETSSTTASSKWPGVVFVFPVSIFWVPSGYDHNFTISVKVPPTSVAIRRAITWILGTKQSSGVQASEVNAQPSGFVQSCFPVAILVSVCLIFLQPGRVLAGMSTSEVFTLILNGDYQSLVCVMQLNWPSVESTCARVEAIPYANTWYCLLF